MMVILQDVGSGGFSLRDGSATYTAIRRSITFFTRYYLVWLNNKLIKNLMFPDNCSYNGILNNQLILDLKSDWTVNNKKPISKAL